MIQLRVLKRLGAFTLDVDCTFAQRVTGLFGPSGSGKSTLLHCIAGLLVPDRGEIVVAEQPYFRSDGVSLNLRAARRAVGYVFQDGLLFEHMSVERNLRYGQPREARGPRFEEVVALLELGALLPRAPRTLSGGEKRRVAIGRALLSHPRCLLLDEPLAGLDRSMAGRVLRYLRETLTACGIPAIYVSHSISDVLYLCDEIIVLRGGRMAANGPPRAVVTRPGGLAQGEYAELENVFDAPVEVFDADRQMLVCRLGEQRLHVAAQQRPEHEVVTLAVRAADVLLACARPVGLSARNVLSGVVRAVSETGHGMIVTVDVGAVWLVELTREAVGELELRAGTPVFAIVKASSVSILD